MPGVDASQLSDNELAMKLAHIKQIRQLEKSEGTDSYIKNLIGG